MNKKKLYIADFNCTFGEENYPLLEYFEEIVYPAFTSNVKRKPSHKNEYFFYNIKLNEVLYSIEMIKFHHIRFLILQYI